MNERCFEEGLISVIIPVYNSSKYIGKTIESVLEQSYGTFEIVIVDDCSQDDTVEIISRYSVMHPNIIFYKQPKNMGVAVARNKALELAKGRYVAFLDSDDIWKADKINRQMQLMECTNAKISYTAIEMMDKDGKLLKGKRKVENTINYSFLLRNTMIATSSVVVDRKQVGDFRMTLRRSGQDYSTWLRLLRNGTVAYGVNEALVRYRTGIKSLSANKFKSIKQVWEIQTKDERIGKIPACFNVVCFCINAMKKYYI